MEGKNILNITMILSQQNSAYLTKSYSLVFNSSCWVSLGTMWTALTEFMQGTEMAYKIRL